jgi:hypothetical protein
MNKKIMPRNLPMLMCASCGMSIHPHVTLAATSEGTVHDVHTDMWGTYYLDDTITKNQSHRHEFCGAPCVLTFMMKNKA